MKPFDVSNWRKFQPAEPDEITKQILLMMSLQSQPVDDGADRVFALLGEKLSKEDCTELHQFARAILGPDKDYPRPRFIARVMKRAQGRLTQEEASLVYECLTKPSRPVPVVSGDGSCAEQAVVIQAATTQAGLDEEYQFIGSTCGQRGVDYTVKQQMQLSRNGREYDVITVRLKDGSERVFWFDITAFFGKF